MRNFKFILMAALVICAAFLFGQDQPGQFTPIELAQRGYGQAVQRWNSTPPDTGMVLVSLPSPGDGGYPRVYWEYKSLVPGMYPHLSVSGDTIFLSNGGFAVAPKQTLALSGENGNLLTILGGNTVVLPLGGDVTTSQLNTAISPKADTTRVINERVSYTPFLSSYRTGDRIGKYIIEDKPHEAWNAGVADGVFSIPVQKTPAPGFNYLRYSDDVARLTNTSYASYELNVTSAPNMRKTADKVTINVIRSSSTFVFTSVPGLVTGDTITLAMWVRKIKDSDVDVQMNFKSQFASGTSTFFVDTSAWKLYTASLVINGDPAGGGAIPNIGVFNSPGTEFYVGRTNIFKGGKAYTLQKTNSATPTEENILYANYYPGGNRAYFSDVLSKYEARETSQKILDFLQATKLGNELFYDVDVTIDSTIVVHNSQTVSSNSTGWSGGSNQSNNATTIYFSPPDGVNNLDIFKVDYLDAQGVERQPKGNRFVGLRIEVLDTCRHVINLGNSTKGAVERCEIIGAYKAQTGVYSGFTDFDTSEGGAGLFPRVKYTLVEEPRHEGVHFEQGNYGDLEGVAVIRSDSVGFRVTSNGAYFENCWVENSRRDGIVANTVNLDINTTYFEGVGQEASTGNIVVNAATNFSATNNNFNSAALTPVRIYLDDVSFSDIRQNRVTTGNLYITTENTGQINSSGNSYPNSNENEQIPSTISDLFINGNDIQNSRLERNTLQGEATVSQLNLVGKRQNFILRSDSLFIPDNVNYTLIHDTIVGPTGLKNAELITINSISGSAQTMVSQPGEPAVTTAGERYTISFWARLIDGQGKESVNVISRHGADVETQSVHVITEEWKRFENTYTETADGAGSIQIRATNTMDSGDQISITDMSFVKGEYPLGQVRTTGTAVDDTQINFIVPETEPFKITGNLLVTGTITGLGGFDTSEQNQGAVSDTPDGSGDITVTHALDQAPNIILLTAGGATPYFLSYHSITGTTFKIRVMDSLGVPVTSGTVNVSWIARIF